MPLITTSHFVSERDSMVSVRVGEGRENEGKLLGGWRISEDVFGWEAPQEVGDARWSVHHQVFPTESWSSRNFRWTFFFSSSKHPLILSRRARSRPARDDYGTVRLKRAVDEVRLPVSTALDITSERVARMVDTFRLTT